MLQISVLGKRRYLVDQLKKDFPSLKVRHIENPSEIHESDDLTFCLSYYKLIKPPLYDLPKYGTFVCHASDLPKGRGWAPVNWAIINGEDQITLTTFKVDGGCDTGPYHIKSSVPLEIDDTIHTAYAKIEIEILAHLKSVVSELLEFGKITLHQQEGEPTFYERRRKKDSELDPNLSLSEQWNKLRACDNDEYPAFFWLHGKKIVLKYKVLDE